MRSVVVVLPASMCAMMPILRTRSNGNCRLEPPDLEGAVTVLAMGFDLPPVMGEGAVRFGHLVSVFSLLESDAFFLARRHQLVGEAFGHRLAGAAAGRVDDPAHGQGRGAQRSDLAGHP